MKTIFSGLLFLLPLLTQAHDDCLPGFERIEDPPRSNNFFCKRTDIVCPGGQDRNYVHPDTNTQLCCPTIQQLVIYDPRTRVGACCRVGQVYAGNAPNGRCCAPGQILRSGECVTPPPPSGGGCCDTCPRQPAGACNLQLACGDSKNNGLQFGKCYQITFPNGLQLGRGISETALDQYAQEGYIQNIIYKVCHNTANCGAGFVADTDTFYIQDMTGSATDTAGKPGWIDNASGGAHMSFTLDATKAGIFKGRTGCSGCKCTVQLDAGLAYPMTQPGITFWPNPKVGLAMQFAEIPCYGGFFNA